MSPLVQPEKRIAERAEVFIERWRQICRFPTVSGDLDAIGRAADWLEAQLGDVCDRTTRFLIDDYGPVVVGFAQGSGPATLMFYTHYDVQPTGEPTRWRHDPFGATIDDGKMFARGACDDKADIAARLAALALWREENGGALPFSVIFLADPCEEIGSPGLDTVLSEHAAELQAQACLWESYLRGEDGRPALGFGCRGSLEVQVSLTLLAANQHPSYAGVLRSAPLELIRTISSLTGPDGTVAIPGFADAAKTPTETGRRHAEQIALPDASVAAPDVRPWLPGTPEKLAERFVFAPTMSLSGFDVDPTIDHSIPATCTARLRFSLVPDMDPSSVFALIRDHIHRILPEAEITMLRAMRPAFSPTDNEFAEAVAAAARHAFGSEPVYYDVMTGAGPGAIFLDHLGAPIISPSGTLRPDGNMHGFDEHGAVDDFLIHIQFTLDILRELAANGFAAHAGDDESAREHAE